MTYKLTTKVDELFSNPSDIQSLIFKYGIVYLLVMILISKFMQNKGYDNIKITFVLTAIYLIINYLISDSMKIIIFKNIKQNAHIYLAVLIAVYYFVFILNGKQFFENFNQLDKKEMCKMKKSEQKKVKFLENEKCKKVNENSREQINNASDCYNFVTQDIVVNRDTDSWCDLDSTDLDIINKLTDKLEVETKEGPDNMDEILKDLKLESYNDNFSDFASF